MRLALAHPKQSTLHDLQGRGLQIDQEKQQPILGGRQRTVLVGRLSAHGAWLPIEAPVGHLRLERGLKGRDERPKLVHRETGQIEHLCRAGLQIGEPSRAHGDGLLSLEAQHTINRD
jgi:hypothetical protein